MSLLHERRDPAQSEPEGTATVEYATRSQDFDNILNEPRQRGSVALQYRRAAIYMLCFYTPLILVPWCLTCVLAKHPIGAASYIFQKGFSDAQVKSLRNWKVAVDVLNSIAGLITIPLLSACLAQAAVVFCQREQKDHFLSLPDLFALSDRGWTQPQVVCASMFSRRKRAAAGAKWTGIFLLPAAGLILLGAIQQPLYQILVPVGKCACGVHMRNLLISTPRFYRSGRGHHLQRYTLSVRVEERDPLYRSKGIPCFETYRR